MSAALPVITAISAIAGTAASIKSMTSKPKSAVSGNIGIEEQAKISKEKQDRAKKIAFQQQGRAATRLSGVGDDTAVGGLATKKLLG